MAKKKHLYQLNYGYKPVSLIRDKKRQEATRSTKKRQEVINSDKN